MIYGSFNLHTTQLLFIHPLEKMRTMEGRSCQALKLITNLLNFFHLQLREGEIYKN